MRFFKSLYLSDRFFIALIVCVLGLFACFIFDNFFFIMLIILGVVGVFLLLDMFTLFRQSKGIIASRNCPERLSNGDMNTISLSITNKYPFRAGIKIIEEVPFQFQKRNLMFKTSLGVNSSETLYYDLRPTERGVINSAL